MLSCLSSNKRSRRVARNLYKNFSGKQNKGYVLAMEKQPIQITTWQLYYYRLYNEYVRTKLVFIVEFYLKYVSDNGLKEASKVKSRVSVKVLNVRRLEHEFSYSMWFDFIVMRFVADTAAFPGIRHVSEFR